MGAVFEGGQYVHSAESQAVSDGSVRVVVHVEGDRHSGLPPGAKLGCQGMLTCLTAKSLRKLMAAL